MRLSFSLFLPLFFILFSHNLMAANDEDRLFVQDWDGTIPAEDIYEFKTSDRISQAVFSMIDKVKLFSVGDDHFKIALKIERDVYRNYGDVETWTVVDRFFIKNSARVSWDLADGADFGFGPSLGGDLGLVMTNIVQVEPSRYTELPTVSEMKREIENSDWFKEIQGLSEPQFVTVPKSFAHGYQILSRDDDDQDEGSSRWAKVCPFPKEDVENRAKFCNIVNRITFPFRIPLNADDIKEMSDDEILAYSFEGRLSFGFGANWSVVPGDLIGAISAGAGFTVYLFGAYETYVLKESDQFVQVKTVEVDGRGNGAYVDTRIGPRILDGLFLIEKLDNEFEIIPFRYQLERQKSQSFELAFRYDLSNPQARHAYERAVRGDMAYSSELAFDEKGNPRSISENGVERVFSAHAKSSYEEERSKVRLAFLYKRKNSSSFHTVDLVFTSPEGVSKTFQAVSNSRREWGSLQTRHESLNYRFAVLADVSKFENEPDAKDLLRLYVEGNMIDSHTKPNEMMNYILEAEDNLSQFGLYFRPPEGLMSNPVTQDDEFVDVTGKYIGASRFYYTFSIPSHLIDLFMSANEATRWQVLERAFGVEEGSWATSSRRFWYKVWRAPLTILNVPLYLAGAHLREGSDIYHAERIERKWAQLPQIKDLKDKAAAFGRLFYDRFYGYELVRVVRTMLDGQEAPFTTLAYSRLSGVQRFSGTTVFNKLNIATIRQKQLSEKDADQKRKNLPDCLDAVTAQINQNRVQLRVNLAMKPRALLFELKERGKASQRLLVHNTSGRFQMGRNDLIWDPADKDSEWRQLAEKIATGKRYDLLIACNPDGQAWTEPVKTTF